MFKETNNMIERKSRRARERLTVIETALASTLVSWVAGSVPACQPVCHQHCLVFSLRTSASSLYTLSCSGLTCFLYINIFITAQMASFLPFQEQEGSSLPGHVLWAGVIFPKKLFYPVWCCDAIAAEETNDHGTFYQSDGENTLIQ